jgi:hypothetical protein
MAGTRNSFSVCLIVLFVLTQSALFGQSQDTTQLPVNKTNHFTITGDGTSAEWKKAEWLMLTQRIVRGKMVATKMKILYSDTGIYCLFVCDDEKITATLKEDFLDLYNEDVVEAFFWPDTQVPIYFEYEVSPLNYELPILVPNIHGTFLGWRPWHYEGNRRTAHKTKINMSGNKVQSWMAEFFIPYVLLKPLPGVPPKKGDRWRANFYRMDYDDGNFLDWSWQLTRTNFHDYERFGTLIFQ